MDKGEEKAVSDIEKYGCHILHVMEEGEYPRFSYSIGIEKSAGQPELVITGLKPEYFGWAIWLYKNDSFKVLQFIYPSTSGVWPWDPEAPNEFTWFIPRLYAD